MGLLIMFLYDTSKNQRRTRTLANGSLDLSLKLLGLARDGHDIAWEFAAGGGYSGRILVDGEILAAAEATKKFLKADSSG